MLLPAGHLISRGASMLFGTSLIQLPTEKLYVCGVYNSIII